MHASGPTYRIAAQAGITLWTNGPEPLTLHFDTLYGVVPMPGLTPVLGCPYMLLECGGTDIGVFL